MRNTSDNPAPVGLYRAGITSPKQLQAVTVAREQFMDDIQEKLFNSKDKSSKQHSLFIGPRGAGKTHLLSLIEQKVLETPKLKERYIVIRFPEESLRLLGYVDFLMQICEILQDVLPPKETAKWSLLYNEFIEEPDSDKIRDTLEVEIRKTGRDQNRTLLIMLENFDEILTRQIDSRHASPKERKGHMEAAALRKWFMGDNGCMLIATAPLYFPGISDVGQPFYDFFDVQTISPLTKEETLQLIQKNLEVDKKTKLLKTLDDLKTRVLALHEMTGGNPRLIMMLYELIARDSVTAVREQFLRLLDRITPFYQDRIKDLPAQESAILETMAKMRGIRKTPAAIAARMRLSQQQTSTLLKRLTKSNYLRVMQNPDDKRSRIYTIREGFFDLWLAMNLSRANRARLPFLVEFFEKWYRSLDDREAKRKSLFKLLKESKNTDEAAVALDHLTEAGSVEEKAGAKIQLAHQLSDIGELEKSSRYIAEFQSMSLDGFGRWVADHADHYAENNMYSDLEEMIACWQTQRAGNLETFAIKLQEMGEELTYKNYSEAKVQFLTESLNHITDPELRIKTRLSIARALQQMARWHEAEKQFSLTKKESEESTSRPFYSSILNNMAQLLKDTNRLTEAEPLMRRALEIDEKNFGGNHPIVAVQLNNLAILLQETNRLGEAEPLMRRALEIDKKGLGSDHPNVAIRLNNLAMLLKDTDRLEEAEPLMRHALEITEKSLGYSHPNMATSLNNLAQLLQDTNRLEEAEPLMRHALEIAEKIFGPDHPSVAIQLNNLAGFLKHTNRPDEAEPLMRRALEIAEESLGSSHPNVAISLNNLAQLLQDSNRLNEAEPLMRRHVHIFRQFEQKTGFPHSCFKTSIKNYTMLLKQMGWDEERIKTRIQEILADD